MKKAIASFLIVAAFIVGTLLGGYAVSRFLSNQMTRPIYSNAAANLTNTLATLRSLREDNPPGAIELLEISLDSNLISLMNYGKLSPAKQDKNILSILKQVKEYRSKYPRKSNRPDFDSAIEKVLSAGDNAVKKD